MSDERTEDAATQEQAAPGEVGPLVGEVAGALWSVLRSSSKVIAQSGRDRLEAYQARKDLAKLYEKLGRETCRLIEAGEIDHPGLIAGANRIARQQEEMDEADLGEE